MLQRTIEVHYKPKTPPHRARDEVDLRDPLLYAIARAERSNIRSLATREQSLAEMVLKMRLVEAARR